MSDLQLEIWNELCKLSGEEVARLFTDWLGDQILDKDFRVYLGTEGYMSEYEEDEPEEEEDDDEDDEDDEAGEESLNDFDKFCESFHYCLACPIMKKYGDQIINVSCHEEFEKMKAEEE